MIFSDKERILEWVNTSSEKRDHIDTSRSLLFIWACSQYNNIEVIFFFFFNMKVKWAYLNSKQRFVSSQRSRSSPTLWLWRCKFKGDLLIYLSLWYRYLNILFLEPDLHSNEYRSSCETLFNQILALNTWPSVKKSSKLPLIFLESLLSRPKICI